MRALFAPILAGATFGGRLVACIGAALSIAFTALVTAMVFGDGWPAVLLVAPMGASAVLIFTVPASPLAQPWAVIGGNVISAVVGVGIASMVSSPGLASGLAVGGAILAMSLLRCLHPPGGAAALTAVMGGHAVTTTDWMFPLMPVGINAVILTAAGVVFHHLSSHSYPHRPVSGRQMPAGPQVEGIPHPEDLDAALADLGETFDIGRDDLELLFDRVRAHGAMRRGSEKFAGRR